MLRPVALPSVCLLAVTSAACSLSTSDREADTSHPAWLVGTLIGPTINGDIGLGTEGLKLNADGTAVETGQTVYHDSYEDPSSSSFDETWSLDGEAMTLGYKKLTLKLAAGCHLVELLDADDAAQTMTYAFGPEGPIAGCPQTEPALTDAEQSLVGNWSNSDASVFLGFDANRAVYWSNDLNVNYLRWSIDGDGTTFHITDPDGTEEDTGTIVINGTSMTICDGSDMTCTTMKSDAGK